VSAHRLAVSGCGLYQEGYGRGSVAAGWVGPLFQTARNYWTTLVFAQIKNKWGGKCNHTSIAAHFDMADYFVAWLHLTVTFQMLADRTTFCLHCTFYYPLFDNKIKPYLIFTYTN
jgi:hypothetical protein